MNIYAMCIKPPHKAGYNPFEWCRQNGRIGIGWLLDRIPRDADDAVRAFREQWPRGRRTAFECFVQQMAIGDFAFLRNNGQFFCCKVTGEWEQNQGSDAPNNELGHLRNAQWVDLNRITLVPGVICRAWSRKGSACERINANDPTLRYIEALFRNKGLVRTPGIKEAALALQKTPAEAIFELSDQNEVEDMVCTLLQGQGWRLQKSTAFPTAAKFECAFFRVTDSRREEAVVQVKSGNVSLDVADYVQSAAEYDKVFLFSGAYCREELASERLVLLRRQELFEYYRDNPMELPLTLLAKLTSCAE
jgi:hypothetical protein